MEQFGAGKPDRTKLILPLESANRKSAEKTTQPAPSAEEEQAVAACSNLPTGKVFLKPLI